MHFIILSNRNYFRDITKEHAQVIKSLRATGCTWGRIAEIMYVVCGNSDESWGQMTGKELCEAAADILGEDPNNEEWN